MDDPNPNLQATTSCPGKSVTTNAPPYTPSDALGWCIGIGWFWCHGGTVDDLGLQGPGGGNIGMSRFPNPDVWMGNIPTWTWTD